ncbi:14620_t:CDS:1, partial [Acaulospora colombiana]
MPEVSSDGQNWYFTYLPYNYNGYMDPYIQAYQEPDTPINETAAPIHFVSKDMISY